MKKHFFLDLCICATLFGTAQNVGIGTTNPLAKLHIVTGLSGFPSTPLPGVTVEGSSNTYINFLTPNASESGVIFGRAADALSGGIVYNNNNNFNGLQFRTNGNQTRMVIDNAGNIGIGTLTPSFPLSFSNISGDKISLWGNSGAHYGLGIQSQTLQIHTDGAGSDIAFGYGSSALFTETMRIKGSGALAMNGNVGQPGQVLQTNGANAPATWVSATNALYNNTIGLSNGSSVTVKQTDGNPVIAGMSYTFSIPGNARLFVSYAVPVAAISCTFCGATSTYIEIRINGGVNNTSKWDVANGSQQTLAASKIIQLGAGTYTVQLNISLLGPDIVVGPCCIFEKTMSLQIVPQ